MKYTLQMRDVSYKDIEEACKVIHEKHGGIDLPYKATLKGFWATSIIQDVYEAFKWAGLENYRHFVDLGSGDGRVVAVASLFTKATGIEIDPHLHQLSIKLKEYLGLNNIEFYLGDFEEWDFDDFDFIYIYPDQPKICLEPKLESTWEGSIMVAGPHFEPSSWKKMARKKFTVEKFTLYQIF